MAKMPIEIVRIGRKYYQEIEEVVFLLNNVQKEIHYSLLPESDEEKFQLLDFRQADTGELLGKIKTIRKDLKGYHPYLIVISNIDLSGSGYTNLFGNDEAEDGVAVFTFSNVPEIIVPQDRIKAYVAHLIALYTFSFLVPGHRTHDDTRECVFDTLIVKTDLLKSMKAGAICDSCRISLMSHNYNISASQFSSLNSIFSKVEELLKNDIKAIEARVKKPKLFIGSSTEGLPVARKIQSELFCDFEVELWNQGPFDRLGLSFLETLEEIVASYDYGIFVFTPDDKIESRGEVKTTARDNVIFESGMFVGKLGRRKAFLVHPTQTDIHILSDFAGITKASYDPTSTNLQAALGPVCERVRASVVV